MFFVGASSLLKADKQKQECPWWKRKVNPKKQGKTHKQKKHEKHSM